VLQAVVHATQVDVPVRQDFVVIELIPADPAVKGPFYRGDPGIQVSGPGDGRVNPIIEVLDLGVHGHHQGIPLLLEPVVRELRGGRPVDDYDVKHHPLDDGHVLLGHADHRRVEGYRMPGQTCGSHHPGPFRIQEGLREPGEVDPDGLGNRGDDGIEVGKRHLLRLLRLQVVIVDQLLLRAVFTPVNTADHCGYFKGVHLASSTGW